MQVNVILSNLARSRGARALALVLVVLLAGTVVLGRGHSASNTEDPLFDRLQAEVLANSAQPMRSGRDFAYMMRLGGWDWAPERAVLESWEDDFSDRSDYWCLRYLCADSQREEDEPDNSLELLERAAACADAGPAVHAALMEKELYRIRYDESLGLDSWEEDAATAELISGYRERFPDSAWVCYIAATHLSWYGLSAEFVEMLELGNSLPQQSQMELFPMSYVVEGLLDGSYSGDPYVAGSILSLRQSLQVDAFSRSFRIKDLYKEMMLVGTELGMERGLTALMHRDIRSRIGSGNPWLLCQPVTSGIMGREVLANNADWKPGSPQEAGVQAWLADWDEFDAYIAWIHARAQAHDPQLGMHIGNTPQWSGMQDPNVRPGSEGYQGLVRFLTQRMTGNLLRHQALQEYRLNKYLVEEEIPHCEELLNRLAEFDYAHPEAYLEIAEAVQ